MGLVRRDWTWNKADLGSHLPPSSLDRQFLLICLVPDTAVSTQRFALSLSFIASVYSPGDLIHSNAGVSSLQAQIGPSCHISAAAYSGPHLATPWTAAYQAPPSMGFSRQEY